MFKTIEEIKAANEALGQAWFGEGEMSFFNTRVHEGVIMGHYFITSDSPDDLPESRRYSRPPCGRRRSNRDRG